MCKKDEGIVMPNFAVPRAAVSSVIYEKPPGGGYPPPVGARVKLIYTGRKAPNDRNKSIFMHLKYKYVYSTIYTKTR